MQIQNKTVYQRIQSTKHFPKQSSVISIGKKLHWHAQCLMLPESDLASHVTLKLYFKSEHEARL